MTNEPNTQVEVETVAMDIGPDAVAETPAEPALPPKSPIALNVTLAHPIIEELKRRDEVPIFMLRVNAEDREAFEKRNPRDENGFIVEGGDDGQWAATYQMAVEMEPSNGYGAKALTREGSQWGQGIEVDGRTTQGGAPELGAQDGPKLTGQKAVMYMRSQMGLGSWMTYPMYASGIWLMLKPPMDDDLLDFDVANSLKRIQLGRSTHGLIYSNQAVMQDGDLWDFIMRHVVNCNVVDWTPDLLASLMLSTDFQALVTHFASTIYPNGYTVAQPCSTDTSKCTYVAKGQVNLTKMVVVDRSMLTLEQKRFIADRFTKRTAEEIRNYQKSGKWQMEKTLAHNGLTITFKIPTMGEYLNSGRMWIEDITTRVEELLGVKGTQKEKDALMTRYSLASLLRYYGHFVKQVETDQAVANDSESVIDMLEILSADVELCEKIFTDASEYLEERTISMACIPAWQCPECGDTHVDGDRRHPYLIPVNASVLFFDLKDRRLSRV